MASYKHLSTIGVKCSDFSYKSDDPISDLQLSNSSQFHLSNLLLLTLVERAIKDKKFLPLWWVSRFLVYLNWFLIRKWFGRNFLVTNKRYHTNMTSIVLCQSGLYSSAVLLASARGAHLDAYCGLVGVSNQEFGKIKFGVIPNKKLWTNWNNNKSPNSQVGLVNWTKSWKIYRNKCLPNVSSIWKTFQWTTSMWFKVKSPKSTWTS